MTPFPETVSDPRYVTLSLNYHIHYRFFFPFAVEGFSIDYRRAIGFKDPVFQ